MELLHGGAAYTERIGESTPLGLGVNILGIANITTASLMFLYLLVTETVFFHSEACSYWLGVAKESWLFVAESDCPFLGGAEPTSLRKGELLL